MLKWIGGTAFVLVLFVFVIFTSVTVVRNNDLLKKQAQQIGELQKTCSASKGFTAKADQRKVKRIINRLKQDTQRKERLTKEINDLRKAHQEATTETERDELLQDLEEAKLNALLEARGKARRKK